MGETIRSAKGGKLVGSDKKFIRKARVSQIKAKPGIHSLLPIGSQVFSIPRRAGIHHMEWCLGKTNTITPRVPSLSSSLFFSPQPWTLITVPYSTQCPLDHLGSTVLAVPPHSILCTPTQITGGVVWKWYSSLPKISLCCHQCFWHKSKTQPHTSYFEDD